MPNPVTQAQPPLEFISPAYNPFVRQAVAWLLPAWLRWNVQLEDIQVDRTEVLVELYRQFQAQDIRFMMAFRHPSTNDPYCLFTLLSQWVPRVAKAQGVALQQPIHAHFIYDRGIPLWAGRPVGWLYSRLGGTPIRRGKVDLMGLRSARQLFAEGQFPIAAAPEGATNGHNEIVSPIEPGISQFGFWCVEDLQKAGRSEKVLIVPIGIQYHYVSASWASIEALLSQLETDSGLPPHTATDLSSAALPSDDRPLNGEEQILYRRLLRLSEHLLTLMEKFYGKFYHQPIKPLVDPQDPNSQIAQRLQALLNSALSVAETYFGLTAKGTLTDRCRRLEQAGWDWIYREDIKQFEALSPIERGLADRIAEEADLRLWHMRLVETFVSVTGNYVLEKPTVERFSETLLLLWDMVTRLKGRVPFPRPQLAPQRVQMTIGDPISVTDRWDSYQANRRQAVGTLTQDLQSALEALIH